jgi:polysaccharide biosynthesis/export protein
MQVTTSRISLRRWTPIAGSCVLLLLLVIDPCAQAQVPVGQDAVPGPESQEPSRQQDSRALPETQETPTIGSDYLIGPEDVLRVDVFDVPELSNLVLRVANDGTIAPPLLGHVKASGLTPSELRKELEAKWGAKYLQNPQVSIFVQEFHAMPVSVVGAVEKPGLYPLTGPRNLIEMISLAGGLAKRTSAPAGRTVYVTREGGFGDLKPTDGMQLVAQDKLEIDIRKLLYSNESSLNIAIEPRDIISVSKADVVYVTGRGVQKPGGFVLEDRDNVTVFQALAMAGGVGPNAKKHDAMIIRRQADGSRTEIPVDLDKVLKGKAPDLTLAANDILFVPDSAQKAALKRGTEVIMGTISGLLIYGRI